MRKFIVIVMLIFSSGCVYAQRTADIGAEVAVTAYWGDMEKVDYTKSATLLYGVFGRLNFNKRLALRGQILTGTIQAEGLFSNSLINLPTFIPTTAPPTYQADPNFAYKFSRTVQTVEGVFEFNFRNYKIGSMKKEWFTPFMSLGLGVLYSRAPLSNSFILDYDPTFPAAPGGPLLSLYSPYVDDKGKKTNSLDVLTATIPVGAGIKFNLTKRVGGMVEFMVRKTFSDNIDNLKDPKRYQNPILSGTGPSHTYLPPISGLNNNDWYASFAFSFSYQFGIEVASCPVYDTQKKIE